MNNVKWLLAFVLILLSAGCSVFPIKAEIEDNHFRFENFKRDKGINTEYVYLMCFHKKPSGWSEPKQFEGGEHDLWVKAAIARRDIENSTKVAYVNFKTDLEPDKSYMLNREIVGDKISIWIQEVDSGVKVSDVETAELKSPLLVDYSLRREQCESGSV